MSKVEVVDFFTRIEDFTIQLPALPRPTVEELQTRWSWIREIKSNLSPTQPVTMELGTLLHTDEEKISGNEYHSRRGSTPYLGFQQGVWLVDHQDDPELAAFRALRGKVYIDLIGLEILDWGGGRDFPDLDVVGGRWSLNWRSTENDDLSRVGRVARPCKQLFSL